MGKQLLEDDFLVGERVFYGRDRVILQRQILAPRGKGGRCSSVAVLGANLLRLRPAIEVTDGKMHVCKKYRGTFEACVKAYIADRLQGKEDLNLRRVFITHSGVPEEIIETAKEAVRQYQNFEEICVTRAGCTVSSHCGPGTIGVLFLHER